jgi:hypothetical protein
LWVLHHLDDLESDFSAIHGISDMLAMPAPRFFRMAERLPAYRGMMRTVVENEAHRRRERFGTAEVTPLTPDMARGTPGLEGLFDHSSVST